MLLPELVRRMQSAVNEADARLFESRIEAKAVPNAGLTVLAPSAMILLLKGLDTSTPAGREQTWALFVMFGTGMFPPTWPDEKTQAAVRTLMVLHVVPRGIEILRSRQILSPLKEGDIIEVLAMALFYAEPDVGADIIAALQELARRDASWVTAIEVELEGPLEQVNTYEKWLLAHPDIAKIRG